MTKRKKLDEAVVSTQLLAQRDATRLVLRTVAAAKVAFGGSDPLDGASVELLDALAAQLLVEALRLLNPKTIKRYEQMVAREEREQGLGLCDKCEERAAARA